MNNGPISVSAPGNSLIGVDSKDVTFSTRYPFHKLDSTNIHSFEITTIFFNTEPPNPAIPGPGATTTSETLVYSYAHGYTYEPSTWFLVSLDNFATTQGAEGCLILGGGFGVSSAYFNIRVDATHVYFYVTKFWPNILGVPTAPNVIGLSVSTRAYIFVEDLSAKMVPSQG